MTVRPVYLRSGRNVFARELVPMIPTPNWIVELGMEGGAARPEDRGIDRDLD